MSETIDLTKECETYIRERLANGNSLSRLALDAFTFSEGNVRLIGPSPSSYSNFNNGGVTSRKESLHELAQFLQRHLTEPECCAIFEDTLAKASDPRISKSESHLALYRDEVYYWLASGEYALQTVEAFIKKPRYSVALVGFLTQAQFGDNHRVELAYQQLRAVTESTRSIIISAFDSEGFIVWDRPFKRS